MEEPPETSIQDLPEEVLSLLFSVLALGDIPSLARASRRYSEVLEDDTVWRTHMCRRLSLQCSNVVGSGWKRLLRCPVCLPRNLVSSTAGNSGLLTSGLSVRFIGPLGKDRAVRADAPVPFRPITVVRSRAAGLSVELSDVFYFEAMISAAPLYEGAVSQPFDCEQCVSIGLCTSKFPLRGKQPGWDAHSVGMHGDDGMVYHNGGWSNRRIGPRFGPGDVVGCGIQLRPPWLIFFTCNGQFLGPAFAIQPQRAFPLQSPRPAGLREGATGGAEAPASSGSSSTLASEGLELFATVGIDSHQRVVLNFGEEPFRYDPSLANGEIVAQSAGSRVRYAFISLAQEAAADAAGSSSESSSDGWLSAGESDSESVGEGEGEGELDQDPAPLASFAEPVGELGEAMDEAVATEGSAEAVGMAEMEQDGGVHYHY